MFKKFIIILSFLFFSFKAFAVNENSTVKVTPLLKTEKSWDGKQIVYPSGEAEITALMVEVAPGGETGWHYHSVPSVGMLLEGTWEVSLNDGQKKQLQAQGIPLPRW